MPATQPPAANATPTQSGKLPEILFWIASALLLFWGLGGGSLRGSEGRWAEISRNMLLTGDYLHPIINAEVYFDKPLLSYWFITGFASLSGSLNEFAIRAPSVLAGLVSLFAIRRLGRRLWSEEVAHAAGWLALTSYGLLYWARTAEADMANMTAAILMLCWFFEREHKPGFWSYFVFYLIGALGSHAKGLTALIVPLVTLVPYLLRERRWKQHLRLSHLLAVLLAMGIYFIPFYLAANSSLPQGYHYPETGLSGLDLVYRENLVRYFEPFDHQDPAYSYLYNLPRLLLPWAPLFIVGLFALLKSSRKQGANTRWLLEAVGMGFLFFTASGSRRWYYMLPILPLCTLLMGVFLAECGYERPKRIGYALTVGILITLSLALLTSPAWVRFFAEPNAYALISHITPRACALGFISLLPWAFLHWRPAFFATKLGMERTLAHSVLAALLVMGTLFYYHDNVLDQFRTTNPFAKMLATKAAAGDALVFADGISSYVSFYLNRSTPARIVESPEALHEFASNYHGRVFFVAQRKQRKAYGSTLAALNFGQPTYEESLQPWDKGRGVGKKLLVWQVDLPGPAVAEPETRGE